MWARILPRLNSTLELDVGDGEESVALERLAIYSVAIVRSAGNAHSNIASFKERRT